MCVWVKERKREREREKVDLSKLGYQGSTWMFWKLGCKLAIFPLVLITNTSLQLGMLNVIAKSILTFLFLQWGSEIWPFEIRKHSKSGLFEGWISNGPYVVGFQMVPTIRKPERMANSVKTILFINTFFVYIKSSQG